MVSKLRNGLRGWRLGLCLAGLALAGVLAARLTLRAEEPGEFTWPFGIGYQSPQMQEFSFPEAWAAAEAQTGMDLNILGTAGAWGEIASVGCPYLVPLEFFGGAEPPPQVPLVLWCILSMGGYAQVTASPEIPGLFAGVMGGFAVYVPGEPVLVQWGSQEAPDPDLSAGLEGCFLGGGWFLGNAYVRVWSPQVPGQALLDNAVSSWAIQGLIRYVPTAPPNRPPVAKASADKTEVFPDQAVQFSSAGSSDPEGMALRFLWEFGDGTTSTEANPSHTYTLPDTFTVRLTVRDPEGLSDNAILTITVQPRTLEVVTRPRNAPPGHQGVGIGAGGIETSAHQADVEIRVSGGGVNTIYLSLQGGLGQGTTYTFHGKTFTFGKGPVAAKLQIGGKEYVAGQTAQPISVQTGPDGLIAGTLTSGNKLGECKILATATFSGQGEVSAFKYVPFEASEISIKFDKSVLAPHDPVGIEIALSHHGQPMEGHQLIVWASQVETDDHIIEFDPTKPRNLNRYVLLSTRHGNDWTPDPILELTDVQGLTFARAKATSAGGLKMLTVSVQDFSLRK